MNILYCDECGSITELNHGPKDGGMRCCSCAGVEEPEVQTKTGLDLLDEPPSSRDDAGLGEIPSLDSGELDLFSTQTIARRREKPKPRTETTLRLIEETDEGTAVETPSPQSPDAGFQTTTVQEERWCIDCLCCDGSLSIEPVSQKSRLCCPRCRATMVIEANGQVSLLTIAPASPQQVAHFDESPAAETTPPPALAGQPTPDPLTSGEADPFLTDNAIDTPATFEEIFSSFEAPAEATASPTEAPAPQPSTTGGDTAAAVDDDNPIDDFVVEQALLDSPLIDEELFTDTLLQETTSDSPTEGLADALLGSTFEESPENRGCPVETQATVGTIALWVTVASLPALFAVLAGHESLAPVTSAFY
ncbi:MAG TPA: hypothetical protein EYN00_02360, partial [Planctomycetes bacterium]|nr:hypothetical protein [Planctomycetota bacterium]